jgi:hypothetical protein
MKKFFSENWYKLMIGSSLLMASFGFMVYSVTPAMADSNNQKLNVNSNYKMVPTNADGSINVKLSDEQINELANKFSSEVVDVAIVGYRARPGSTLITSGGIPVEVNNWPN